MTRVAAHRLGPAGRSAVCHWALAAVAAASCVRNTPTIPGAPAAPAPDAVEIRVVAVAADAPAGVWSMAADLARQAADADVPALVLVPRWEHACPPPEAVAALVAAKIPTVPPEVAASCDGAAAQPPKAPEGAGVVRVDRLGRVRRLVPSDAADLAGTDLDAFDVVVLPDGHAPDLAAFRGPDGAPRPPALLLSSSPLEAAGVRGVGGKVGDATIRYAPRAIRETYTTGRLVGVIAGGERDLWAVADLTRGTMRADRIAPPHPVFHVTVPSPLPRTHGERWLRMRSMAVTPDVLRSGPGLAVLDVSHDAARIHLVDAAPPPSTAQLEASLRTEPAGPRDFGPIHPCPRCSPVPADARP